MTTLALPTRILVRTDVDYGALDALTFASQADDTQPVMFIRHAASAGYVSTFRDVFGVDFFEYRGIMKALGARARALVEGARLTEGFADFDAWLDDPEEELVFPIDDDDVFHPQLSSLSATLRADAAVIAWEHAAVGFPGGGSLPAVHRYQSPLLLSNNWGVRKSFLRELPRDLSRRFLAHHDVAHETLLSRAGREPQERGEGGLLGVFAHELDSPEVQFISGHHGLQFFHPGSLFVLSAGGMSRGLGKYLGELDLGPVVLPAELDWARPYVAAYEALLARLQAGRTACLPV